MVPGIQNWRECEEKEEKLSRSRRAETSSTETHRSLAERFFDSLHRPSEGLEGNPDVHTHTSDISCSTAQHSHVLPADVALVTRIAWLLANIPPTHSPLPRAPKASRALGCPETSHHVLFIREEGHRSIPGLLYFPPVPKSGLWLSLPGAQALDPVAAR